jgi:hypothetical protein
MNDGDRPIADSQNSFARFILKQNPADFIKFSQQRKLCRWIVSFVGLDLE